MNAEEFYNKWIVRHPDPYALLTGKPFADEFIKKSLIGFAEAYHKSKVEAISDKVSRLNLYLCGVSTNQIDREKVIDKLEEIEKLLKQ